jgi:hypothetical protein
MYQVSQASFIKIPPFLFKISCGKRNGQTEGRTDGQGDYYRAPASRCGALITLYLMTEHREHLFASFASTSLEVEELYMTGFGEKLVRQVEKCCIDVHTEDHQKINVEAATVSEIAAPIEMYMKEVYMLPYIRNSS